MTMLLLTSGDSARHPWTLPNTAKCDTLHQCVNKIARTSAAVMYKKMSPVSELLADVEDKFRQSEMVPGISEVYLEDQPPFVTTVYSQSSGDAGTKLVFSRVRSLNKDGGGGGITMPQVMPDNRVQSTRRGNVVIEVRAL